MNYEHTALALDVVSDMLRHSLFAPKEIDRERSVIIEEIKMYDENPVMTIEDLFETAVFGSHHPLGWNIAGPSAVIRNVSRSAILRYRDRYYHAGNMWVVIAGKLGSNIDQRVRRYFAAVKRQPRTPVFRPYRPAASAPVRLKYKELEQAQVGLGTRAFDYNHRRLPALQVLSVILGGNMSSRLFIQVRERRGLAYSVSAAPNAYEDTGCLMVHAGVEKGRVEEAVRVIVDELRKMKTTRVGAAELSRAKEYIRGKTILSLEDSDSLASWYGRQALFAKKMLTPEESLQRIAKVTAADVQRVAKFLFRPSQMRMAVIGPFIDPKPFAEIIEGV